MAKHMQRALILEEFLVFLFYINSENDIIIEDNSIRWGGSFAILCGRAIFKFI